MTWELRTSSQIDAESLEGCVDLGISSRIVIFKARCRSKSHAHIKLSRANIGSQARKINNELKSSKVTEYIYSFRNI